MSNTKLYYIENVGCDDTTHGLVRISDEDFPRFKSFIENLNKNSTYQCMPTLHLYEIDENELMKPTDNHTHEDYLYLDDEIYVINYESRWNERKMIV